MKLTKWHLETLKEIEKGEVTHRYHGDYNFYICGSDKDIIDELLEYGLIHMPWSSNGYVLSDAGRAALESARQKEGK